MPGEAAGRSLPRGWLARDATRDAAEGSNIKQEPNSSEWWEKKRQILSKFRSFWPEEMRNQPRDEEKTTLQAHFGFPKVHRTHRSDTGLANFLRSWPP